MGHTDDLTDGASASIPAVSIVEHVSNYERNLNALRRLHTRHYYGLGVRNGLKMKGKYDSFAQM